MCSLCAERMRAREERDGKQWNERGLFVLSLSLSQRKKNEQLPFVAFIFFVFRSPSRFSFFLLARRQQQPQRHPCPTTIIKAGEAALALATATRRPTRRSSTWRSRIHLRMPPLPPPPPLSSSSSSNKASNPLSRPEGPTTCPRGTSPRSTRGGQGPRRLPSRPRRLPCLLLRFLLRRRRRSSSLLCRRE